MNHSFKYFKSPPIKATREAILFLYQLLLKMANIILYLLGFFFTVQFTKSLLLTCYVSGSLLCPRIINMNGTNRLKVSIKISGNKHILRILW